MGRPGSTGLPFLVKRSSAGSYLYHRKVPDEVSAFVAGRIKLPWMKSRDLAGGSTIKISLKTSDLRTARERWGVLHPKVEVMVMAAMALAWGGRRDIPSPPVPISALGANAIRRLAGQVRHDVLAADDATWEQGHESPLGGVIAGLIKNASQEDAERTAQVVEARLAKRMLAERDRASFDHQHTEGELNGPSELVLDILRTVPGPLSDQATQLLLTDGSRNAIPSDVEALLNENGITLPRDHPDRRALALAMLRAKVEGFRGVEARLRGEPVDTPERPPLEPAPSGNGARLSDMRDRWITLFEPGPKAVDDNRLYVGRFIEMFGDLPVKAVTRKMIRDFRDTLATSARDMPQAVRATTFKEQLAWAATHLDVPRLSRQTVNRKGIGSISACMRAAIEDEIIEVNPCTKQDLPNAKGPKVRRLPYSLEDLIKIFQTPIYTAQQKRWLGGGGEAAFWMPLIALFSGARLEEIGQLLCADIKVEDGIVYFDFIDLSDEDEADAAHVKKLKTPNARRVVPVHPELVALGFLVYVALTRSCGDKRLFPALKPYRGRTTHNWSKWWARHTDIFVTPSRHKVFHSFRHKFIDRSRNQKLDKSAIKALVGHSTGDVTDQYGESISLATRYEVICALTYPGLDLSHLRTNNRSLSEATGS